MSAPLRIGYKTITEINDRLAVLYEKADAVVVYNRTRDRYVLDEKQVKIMESRGLVVGADPFPRGYLGTIAWTIQTLKERRHSLAAKAEIAA